MDNRVGRIDVGGGVVQGREGGNGGKWGQLYLNNNFKKPLKKKK